MTTPLPQTHATICALATAPLPAGVAIIRVSGPAAWQAAASVCPQFYSTLGTAQANTAIYAPISFKDEMIDRAVLLPFRAPRSFTGEDVVEIQCHGGMAVVQAILNALLQFPTVRMAEAGEFTRRAFMNNKLDLTQAEGLADLIAAETEEQRRQAVRQMGGELGNTFENWRAEILLLLAQVEAGIDFPDEELDILADTVVLQKLERLLSTFATALASSAGERLREGFKLVIVGKPNAGKSTLTNVLTGRETAIVSPLAGTTRDVVEARLNIGGFPVTLADTAGLRADTTDAIEQEGIRRASQHAKQADVTIAVVDAAEWPTIAPEVAVHIRPHASVVVVSKADKATPTITSAEVPVLALNLTDAASLPPLLAALETLIRANFAQAQGAAQLTRQRHRTAITAAQACLHNAQNLLRNPPAGRSISELLAQDLRDAASHIGLITGRTTNEDVLDVVFSTFCVGK
ncbi:MAG: tRNA uridine-5-carboxymethylaminomethyl(34) synthesis GTPase MnmE [Alphaproteobacteria bacterium]